MICKNCKHYKAVKGEKKYGYCKKMRYIGDISILKVSADIVYCCDSEGYHAWTLVGENYGCIHFKEKKGGEIMNNKFYAVFKIEKEKTI